MRIKLKNKIFKKKKIVIVADSNADLLRLSLRLRKYFEIIWLTYHREVYKELKKLNFKKLYLCNLTKNINVNFFFGGFIQKIFDKISNVLRLKRIEGFLEKIKYVEKKENPFCFIADTFDLLKFYETNKPKLSFGHSVTYKKFFLERSNLTNYDYLFLPGNYHLKRIKKYFSLNNTENLKVLGSIKISPSMRSNINKKKFNKNIKLKYNFNVLFAPSHDAHDLPYKVKFFPKKYGDQMKILEKLALFLDKLGANLIIKLHHYHTSQISTKIFNKHKNVHIFKSGNFFDVKESSEFISNSDIIITDTSGVGTTGIYLNKKMVFIEPSSKKWSWKHADIESYLRPGYVCHNYKDLKRSLNNYINKKDNFKKKRNKFVKKVFYKPHKDATIEIAKFIRSIS